MDDEQQVPRDRDEEFASRPYEDELDTDDEINDPVMAEQTDDPTRELGVPPEELKREFDKMDPETAGGEPEDDEDMREAMEDNDENMGDRTVY